MREINKEKLYELRGQTTNTTANELFNIFFCSGLDRYVCGNGDIGRASIVARFLSGNSYDYFRAVKQLNKRTVTKGCVLVWDEVRSEMLLVRPEKGKDEH